MPTSIDVHVGRSDRDGRARSARQAQRADARRCGRHSATRSTRSRPTIRCAASSCAARARSAFSPGNDIAEFATRAREQGAGASRTARVMHATPRALADCPAPLVAQIHGICVGGGLEIAAMCDLRICGASSRFGAPIKNLGLVMAYAEMAPLVRLVGTDVALEILLEGRIFDAAEAMAKGLVTRVVAGCRRGGRSRGNGRSASPKVRRSSRAGTRNSRAGSADPAPLSAGEARRVFRLLRHRGLSQSAMRRFSRSGSPSSPASERRTRCSSDD